MPIKRKIILGLSDIHSGFTLGLCSPDVKLEDELGNFRQVELSASQEFLWETYTQGIEKTKELAGKDDIYVFSIGDITHGNKHVSQQMTTRMSDQLTIAYENFLPVLGMKNVKVARLAIGTGAHTFGEGSSDIILTEKLRLQYPKIDIKCLYHGLADVDGFKIDYAHHGPRPGSRNWLMGNDARLYLKSKMMSDLDNEESPADLVLRGHYHTYTKEWCGINRNGKLHESWLVIMPALCLLGDYGIQATSSVYRISPGVVAFEIINGRLHQTYPFIQKLDCRVHETL